MGTNKPHFEAHHENDKDLVCMGHGNQCSILVEIDADLDGQRILEGAAERALSRLDVFSDGQFSELFEGLHIKIGDGLTSGGGEALEDENTIFFDRQKMLLSLKESEDMLSSDVFGVPTLDQGDWTGVMSEEEASQPGSCLEYNLIHEVGHLLDEQLHDGREGKRVGAEYSPTKYGRVADQHHEHKEHEAFAEGFAYTVYGHEVHESMRMAIEKVWQERVRIGVNHND